MLFYINLGHVRNRSAARSFLSTAKSFVASVDHPRTMVAHPWLRLLDRDDDDASVTHTVRELKELVRRLQQLERENAELRREFAEYRKRHPETVGVKNGQPYAFVPSRARPSEPKRTLGAKRGHPGAARPLPDRIDRVVAVPLWRCPHCRGTQLSEVQEVRSRLVEELPIPLTPEVTDYRVERRYCRSCRKLVEAPLIEFVLPGARLGLNAMLLVAWLKLELRMPQDRLVELLRTVFGLTVSEGEVHSILAQLTEAFGAEYRSIVAAMRSRLARGIDDTHWRVDGENRYLWACVTDSEAVYRVAASRAHTVPMEMVGTDAPGTDIHDRFAAFETLAAKSGRPQQVCWAHLLQDGKELAEFYGDEGARIHEILAEVYRAAQRVAGAGTEEDVAALTRWLEDGLEPYRSSSHCRRFVRGLLRVKEWLFRFVVDPAVEPTNNRTERALRPMVVVRKVSGGSRSEAGAHRLSVLATVFRTWRIQERPPFEQARWVLRASAG